MLGFKSMAWAAIILKDIELIHMIRKIEWNGPIKPGNAVEFHP